VTSAYRFADLSSGLRMGYVEVGPPAGEPVVLLHGFPEFHYSWRLQGPALADAGFRVIAPDQRGYNRTDKTPPYDIDTLSQDVADLQDALGITRSHIVGHDWGGVVSYAFAARFPQRVNRLVILNVPHPDAYLDSVPKCVKQVAKSWYVYAFQLPDLPERGFERNNYEIAEKTFSTVKHMSPEDIERYKEAYRQPGAISAMIGWYRALAQRIAKNKGRANIGTIAAPTLVIWGENDVALEKCTNETLAHYAPNSKIVYLPKASHWAQLDEPEIVNRLLLEFLPAQQPQGIAHSSV
jgi:pimeloyl-ACP methyl ester carboxylesterase